MAKINKKFNKKVNLTLGLIVLVLGILVLVLPDLLRAIVGLALLFWASQILFPLFVDWMNRKK